MGGRHAYFEYIYSHGTANEPSLATGEIAFINSKNLLIQRHETMGYQTWAQPQFALLNFGSYSEVWVKATPGIDAGDFNIRYNYAGTMAEGDANDTDLSDNGGILTVYEKLRDNAHIVYQDLVIPTGALGVGTSTPTTKLDVVGDMKVSGNMTTDNALVLNKAGKNWLLNYDAAGGYFYIDELGTARHLVISNGGNVGIGTIDPDSKLAVNGTIHSKEVKVDMNGWADHVFKPSYKLASLNEVKNYIDQNKHFPNVPSEQEVAKDGVNLGEMNKILLKKVEELTLYLIEKDKKDTQRQNLIKNQQREIATIKKKLFIK